MQAAKQPIAQLDVALRLRQAMEAHRQNKFTEAERAYRAILDTAPDCYEALHFLGLAYLQQHKLPEALDLVSRALKAKPQSADSLAMRGVVLSNLGRDAEAVESHDALVALRPEGAETYYNRGVSLAKLGRYDEAVASYRQSIALKSSNPQVFHNLGNALLELNRSEEALDSYDRALARAPDHLSALTGRGQALHRLDRHADALACCDRVLTIDLANFEAMDLKCAVLNALDRHADVLACADAALALAPDAIRIVNARCVALQHLGHFDEAQAGAMRALTLDADNAAAHFNLGNALYALGFYEDAEASYRQSIALAPDNASACKNLGGALLALEQYDNALNSFGRALDLGAQIEDTRTSRSLVYFRIGDFERGWADYHCRFGAGQAKDWRAYSCPLWDGKAIEGPLLVWGEQGLGDQILYASMIEDLRARVPSIVIEAERRLVPLFARSFPGIGIVPLEKALTPGTFAAHSPCGTLGQVLRPSWDSFSQAPGGFLTADPEKSSALRARLKTDDRLVVGLSWRSANRKFEKAKSAGLQAFAPLLKLPNCRFIDLQYGDTSVEREEVARETGVEIDHLDDIDNMNDIDGLAALISACDLVVTVSNTTAHLAGALGKETIVLVPYGQAHMWYWFHDRADNPFYPEITIRRQARTHDWASLMAPVADEIALRKGS